MHVSPVDILSGTPTWVFILFAYLIWLGAKRLQPRVREFSKIWIMPGFFIAWGLVGLFQRSGDLSSIIEPWAVGAAAGGALGMAFGIPLQVDRARRLVLLPGSMLPLLRILIIFGAHYALRVAIALHPQANQGYLAWDILVSGASAGYFLGWSIRFLRSYRQAPEIDLQSRAAPQFGPRDAQV